MSEKYYNRLPVDEQWRPADDEKRFDDDDVDDAVAKTVITSSEAAGKWRLRLGTCFKKHRPGWKWVILLAAFFVRGVFTGILANYTTLSVKLRDYYGTNEQLIGWVGSLSLGTRCLLSPLTVAISVKIGYRATVFLGALLGASSLLLSSFVSDVWWFFLTYSVLFGGGMSLACFSSYDYLMSYFHKEFIRGSGFMAIASSIGLMIVAPVMESCLESIGLHNTLRVFAGLVLLTAFTAFAFRPSPAEKRRMSVIQSPPIAAAVNLPQDRKASSASYSSDQKTTFKPPVHTKKTPKETVADYCNILKSPDMWILNGVSLTLCLASTFTFLNMVSFLNSIGLSVKTSAFTLSMMGVGEFVGTALSTLLGDRVPLLKMEVLAIVCLAAAMVTAALTVVTVYPGVLTLVIVMGVCRAIYNLMLYPVVMECMGKDRKMESCSVSGVMCGIGYMPGGVIGGALYDATGSYTSSLLVCVALYMIAFALLLWTAYRSRRATRLKGKVLSQSEEKNREPSALGEKEVYLVEMLMTTV